MARTRHILLLVALVLLWAGAVCTAQPNSEQIENSAGTTYVVAFPDTTKNTFDARYPNLQYEDKAILFIYTAVDNSITIRGRGYSLAGKQILGGKFTIIDLSGGATRSPNPILTEHCKPVDNSFRIEADHPIVVYQYLVTKFGTEAWTPLPVEGWGREYYAAAIPGEVGSDITPGGEFDYNRKNKMFPAEILVIAAYDDTRITVVPNGAIHTNCQPTNITLKAGEVYQMQSYVDTLTANVSDPDNMIGQPDFGGSRIFSTKPVGVITGNTRAQTIDEKIGLGRNSFKNMLIEALAPVEQHGTEFVYMPTWDSRRPTGNPGEDPAEKRKAEFVRIYGTDAGMTGGYFLQNGVPVNYDQDIAQGRFVETRHTPNLARVHRTDRPAQAMMHAPAVVKYAGTTQGFGGYIGAAYDSWGGYMVELTPREQWVGFAPYYASTHPAGMEHFINVVTDTLHMNDVLLRNGANFIFQRRIEGTDLVWGSMAVQPGVDHHLEGRNGARFAGFVYGGLSKGGHEEYRPGRVRERDDNPPNLANRGDDEENPELLHPSEYEEYLAIAYGYPLAPSRLVIVSGDSLAIRTTIDCEGLTIMIEAINENPVGLRSIRLDSGNNAKIVSQTPFPITGAVRATVVVGPINAQQDASATVVIKDATGKITRVAFTYFAERLAFDPFVPIATRPNDKSVALPFDFGVMTPGSPAELTRTAINPLGRPLTVKGLRLITRNPAFTIKAAPAFPLVIAPGDSLPITVVANPLRPDMEYIDTLEIQLECSTWKIPIIVQTQRPCVSIHDLDFGTLAPGQSRTMPLKICNDGSGTVTFSNPTADTVLSWISKSFSITRGELDRLKAAALNAGDCITVNVAFTADTGSEASGLVYRDSARLWASTRECRDISVWTARVQGTTSAPVAGELANALGLAEPNPFTGSTTIPYTLGRSGYVVLAVYDERGERVATIVDGEREAGAHTVTLDASDLPAGVYHYRISIGGWSQTRSVVRR